MKRTARKRLMNTLPQGLSVNPLARFTIRSIGTEQRPVAVVEDFVTEPQLLLEYAESGEPFRFDPRDYYPGVRKRTPPHYAHGLCEIFGRLLSHSFSMPAGAVPAVVFSALSITTTEPSQLRLVQRVPHFDSSAKDLLAVVHYLCGPEHGGTSFYRHRKTGFETIAPDRMSSYADTLKQEVIAQPPSARYIDGDTPLFERIASFEARFNRALIYPANILHSGDIRRVSSEWAQPRTGRLTANALIHFVAQ